MRRLLTIRLFSVALLMWLSAGCRSTTTPALPTATLLPTQVISTFTPTFLPPPTVTLYPTATARNGQVIAPVAGIAPAPGEVSTELPTAAPVIVATSIPPTATASPPPTATFTPTVTIVDLPAGASLGDMIYFSDFSAGWPSFNDPTAKISLNNGQYQFEVGPFDGRFLNTTLVKQRNLYAQVEVTPSACADKAGYGMMFRFKDANNYYLLSIFCDSSYTAVAKIAGTVYGMTNGILPTGIDPTNNQVHTVGVVAREDNYTLYLNKQIIGSFTDPQLKQGDVAIYAVSQGAQVLKASFDNLKIWNVY
jgi:hypothetical protein